MPTYAQIKRQIDLNPFANLMLRSEFKALPSIIKEDEYIDAAVHGYWNTQHVLLLATTQRILLVDGDGTGDIEVIEFPYSAEITVRCPRPDAVVFGTENRKIKVDNALEEYIQPFYEVVKSRLEGKQPPIHREYDIYSKQPPIEGEQQAQPISNPFNVLLRGIDGLTKLVIPSSQQPPQQQEEKKSWTDDSARVAQPQEPEKSLEQLLNELNGLVGLQSVKDEVKNLVDVLKVEEIRRKQGIKLPERSLHMVFHGNPGTGKTTIARLLAKIFKALGILSKGQLYETDRSGLVAGYTGQTSLKTREVCQKALGGILFIDEAYALNTDDTYGPEAVNTIVKFMEDNREDFVVIVAGYEQKMQEFIDSNPGLHSRFNKYIQFKDYTPDELFDIFLIQANKADLLIEDKAMDKLKTLLQKLYDERDDSFGNGRLVRNIFEKTYEKQASRLVKEDLSKAQLNLIKEEDIPEMM